MRSRLHIEDLATDARREAGQLRIPVDPIAVARKYGAAVISKSFTDDLSGVLVRQADVNTIAINEKDSFARKRFTIAHECGHLILGHKGEVFIDKQTVNRRDTTSSLAIDNQEIEANQFAASLLMPRTEVVAHLDQISKSCKHVPIVIEMMARTFGVSKKAMEYRLVNLGLLASLDDE